MICSFIYPKKFVLLGEHLECHIENIMQEKWPKMTSMAKFFIKFCILFCKTFNFKNFKLFFFFRDSSDCSQVLSVSNFFFVFIVFSAIPEIWNTVNDFSPRVQ